MKPCDQFQTQLLEHLYGALEPDESRVLADHLGRCSACQAELVRAEEQMALIGAAAKAEFPWVRFDIPPLAPSRLASWPISRGPWLRWGVAAAIFLALAGIGIPGIWFWRQQEQVTQAETQYKDAADELAQVDMRRQTILQSAQSIKKDYLDKSAAVAKALEDLQTEARQLGEDWRKQRTKTLADLNAKQMNLIVVAPKALAAGGRHQINVRTEDLRKRPAPGPMPARISLVLTDQNDHVVYKEENVSSQGNLTVTLPPDLPLKPNTQLNLQVSAKREQGQQGLLNEMLSLTGPVYLTHLATDKPMYRPGETVRFRSLTLERFSLRPVAEDLQLVYSISKPTGEKVEILRGSSRLISEKREGLILGPDHQPVRGIGAGEYRLDPDASGGEYTLTVTEADNRFPPQSRKFLVNRHQKPPLNNEREPSGKTANAGDTKLQVDFFPEGGDLVADLSNRVYFQVRAAQGKPAEVTGRILNEADQPVTPVATWSDPDHPEANQGRGVFIFTPQAGKKYRLTIDRPSGIEGTYFLPEVKTEGVVLSIAKGVIREKEPIHVRIQSGGGDRSLLVGAYCRGRLMAQQTVEVNNREAKEIELGPDGGVGGVYRITVFERVAGQASQDRLVPMAERLIYRAPAERLNLAIKSLKQHYAPGEKVHFQVEARNEKNQPTPAIVMMAVVDQTVLKRAGEKTYQSMPAHFLLTTEVHRPQDLEDADFLLGPHSSAAEALDLLLGTQGWRRFAEQDPNKFRQEQKEEAQRWLALAGQLPLQTVDYSQKQMQKLAKEFESKALQLEGRLTMAEETQTLIRQGDSEKKELARLKTEAQAAESERLAAVAHWDEAKTNLAGAARHLNDFKDLLTKRALPALMVFCLIAGLAGLGMGLIRGRTRQAVPYFATAGCSLLVLGFLTITEMAIGKHISFDLGEDPTWVSVGSLSNKDHVALFSLDDALVKKDKQVKAKAPLPAVGPKIMTVRPKQGSPGHSPREVGVQKSSQAERQVNPEQAPSPLTDRAEERSLPAKGRTFAGIPLPPPAPPSLVVREYAHVHPQGERQDRADLAETLFWQPLLVLPDGSGEVSFDLNDSATTFQVLAIGHTLDGRLAEVTTELKSGKR